jgi:hypothetical protein
VLLTSFSCFLASIASPPAINPVALRDLPGHSTIAITADLYSHLETNHLKQSVAASGKMLRKEK